MMTWDGTTLAGRSKVVVDDPYVLTFYAPKTYRLQSASVNGSPVKAEQDAKAARLSRVVRFPGASV
ncbi:MAG: hypothetical protein AB2L20_12735 [Mangrovibacterium sp.]